MAWTGNKKAFCILEFTRLTSAASPRLDISSNCKVGQKLGMSLPLLTCSPLAWPSRLLYRRGRNTRRDLWITLYFLTLNLRCVRCCVCTIAWILFFFVSPCMNVTRTWEPLLAHVHFWTRPYLRVRLRNLRSHCWWFIYLHLLSLEPDCLYHVKGFPGYVNPMKAKVFMTFPQNNTECGDIYSALHSFLLAILQFFRFYFIT